MPQIGFGGGMGGTWFGNISKEDQAAIIVQLDPLVLKGDPPEYPELSKGETLFCIVRHRKKKDSTMWHFKNQDELSAFSEQLSWERNGHSPVTSLDWFRGNQGDAFGQGKMDNLQIRGLDWLAEIKVALLAETGFDFKNPVGGIRQCWMRADGVGFSDIAEDDEDYWLGVATTPVLRSLDAREREVWDTLKARIAYLGPLKDKDVVLRFLIMPIDWHDEARLSITVAPTRKNAGSSCFVRVVDGRIPRFTLPE